MALVNYDQFFASACPEDVLLIIFEMLSTREVITLCSVSRGVHDSLQGPPTSRPFTPPWSCPISWALAARSKLRLFLPAGPLFTLSTFQWRSSNDGILGDAFPFYRDAVEDSAVLLYASLGEAIGVPPGDVSQALQYTFGPAVYTPGPGGCPHKSCCRYDRTTPSRGFLLGPLPLFAPAAGLQLYRRVSEALACGQCGSSGSAERQCAHCGTLLCSSCSTRCSRDCAYALCPDCMVVDEDERAAKVSVFALDEGIGLAQPLCDQCGVDLVCPLHQCMINHNCDRCGGMRCDEHIFDHPAFHFCSGYTPGCQGSFCDDCIPPEGGIEYCDHCYSTFCAVCMPLLKCPGVGGVPCTGGRCKHCYEEGKCPSCGCRE